MFCPRCGAENDEGSRYCASCGAELPKQADSSAGDEATGSTLSGRVERLIGRDRRTRMLTLGTVAALLLAAIAFLALDASDEGSDLPQDAYARAADAACVRHKQEIARVQRTALAGNGFAAVSNYSESIVPIAGEWRQELSRVTAPPNRADLIEALGAALLEVQIEAGTLARVARESNPREVAKVAARMDAATANVEAAVDSLDLVRCGRLSVDRGLLVRQ
jgi:hypothetical protein